MVKISRVLVAVTCAMLATGSLTACSPAPTPKTDSISVWVDELEAKALEKAAAEFEKDTKVKVNLVVQQDPRSNFFSQAATGSGRRLRDRARCGAR